MGFNFQNSMASHTQFWELKSMLLKGTKVGKSCPFHPKAEVALTVQLVTHISWVVTEMFSLPASPLSASSKAASQLVLSCRGGRVPVEIVPHVSSLLHPQPCLCGPDPPTPPHSEAARFLPRGS